MNSATSTNNLSVEIKTNQENILLEIIKEVCHDPKLPLLLRSKVWTTITECDISDYSSLHTINTTNETISTLFGFPTEAVIELTYEEQAEFNQSIIGTIQNRIPIIIKQLKSLKTSIDGRQSRQAEIKHLQKGLDDKLNTLGDQENEMIGLMRECLDHKFHEVTKFSQHSSDLLCLKANILELKSKILHIEIQRAMFTETNKSVEAYTEIHKDLKDSIQETEQEIKDLKETIKNDY